MKAVGIAAVAVDAVGPSTGTDCSAVVVAAGAAVAVVVDGVDADVDALTESEKRMGFEIHRTLNILLYISHD